jgi:hypothetical protein
MVSFVAICTGLLMVPRIVNSFPGTATSSLNSVDDDGTACDFIAGHTSNSGGTGFRQMYTGYKLNNTCIYCPFNSVRLNNDTSCTCVPGAYLEELDGRFGCLFCPDGYSTSLESVSTDLSVSYYYGGSSYKVDFTIVSTFTNHSECSRCPAGTISDNYNPSITFESNYTYDSMRYKPCSPCMPGMHSNSSGTNCIYCQRGTFNPDWNQHQCQNCLPGGYTAGEGSLSEDQCFNPVPNFALGFLTLFLVFLIFAWYIVLGKFYRLSFERKLRSVLPNIERCKQLIHYQTSERRAMLRKMKISQHIPRFKATLFLLFATVCCCVLICFFYVLLVYQVFFSSVIIWRGFQLYFDLSPITSILNRAYRDIVNYLKIPAFFVVFLKPFFGIFDFLGNLHISLSSIQVTCSGSQAPAELLINCFIFGTLIVVIRSDYQIFTTLLLSNVNRNYIFNTFEKQIDKGNLYFGKYFYLCLLISLVILLNPFQLFLRYMMGFINISSFSVSQGVFHASSRYCNDIALLDSALAITSSVFAWYLILPCVYCLAEVVTPKLIFTGPNFRKLQVSKYMNPRNMKESVEEILRRFSKIELTAATSSRRKVYVTTRRSDSHDELDTRIKHSPRGEVILDPSTEVTGASEILLTEFDKMFPSLKFNFRNKKEKLNFIR